MSSNSHELLTGLDMRKNLYLNKSMVEMISQPPPAKQVPNVSAPNGSSLKWVIILAVLIVALIGGTFFLSSSKGKPSATKQTATHNIAPTSEPSPNPNTNVNEDLKGPFTFAQRTTVPKSVVCYRFTSFKEALMNIDAACILDLSGQKITALPDETARLTKLEEIYLSGNRIREFPGVLLKIPTLQIIDLRGNLITQIPSSITSLKNLQRLSLASNSFKKAEREKITLLLGDIVQFAGQTAPSTTPTPTK